MTVEEPAWDMDGTLLDTTAAVPAAFVRAVRVLGGPDVGADDVVGAYWRGTPEVILEHLVGRRLAPPETEAYYRELADVDVAPYPGVADAFAALRAQGRALAVFTGASTRAADMLLRSAGLRADVLIGGDQVAHPKPAPDGILLAARKLGVRPAGLAYVGDSPLDLRAAAAAGSRGAAAAWGHMYDRAERADVVLPGPLQALDLLAVRGAAM
ncbi:hydrolase [Streptomyces sp. CB02923]|uniref:HAD family hydrolase n=1 Tax=Streptomyces sp. CB02923 TaxID=1718985 RepID=UPI000938AFCB|nr:HAD-IA family hydrolase [Streptomyces sp. CB02923]OKI02027.1 hydrolase [Streptomyces sp. CB02923]